MKSIVIIANSSNYLYLLKRELIDSLAASGYRIILFANFDGGQDYFLNQGYVFENVFVNRRGKNPIDILKLFFSYIYLLGKYKPNMVLTFTIKPNIFAGIAARFLRIPYIATITGLGSAFNQGEIFSRLISFLYRIALKKTRHVFFQNKSNAVFMEDRHITKGLQTKLVAGSGVDINRFCYQPYPKLINDSTKFLFIGRLMREKGMIELLDAAACLYEKDVPFELHIVGPYEEYDLKDKLEYCMEKYPVFYHGEVKDVRPFIESAHVTVLPSYHEGMANVLLETAASGRPVIATRIPGCMETFDEGISGLGCEPRSAEDLACAMEEFILLPHVQKQQMGLAGRAKMEREFDRRKVINAYLEEIDKVWKEQQTL